MNPNPRDYLILKAFLPTGRSIDYWIKRSSKTAESQLFNAAEDYVSRFRGFNSG